MGNLNFSLQVCAQIIRWAAGDPPAPLQHACLQSSDLTFLPHYRLHDTTGMGQINQTDFFALHKFLEVCLALL